MFKWDANNFVRATDSRCTFSLSKNVDLNFSGLSLKAHRASKGMLRSRAPADAIANGAAPSRKLCLLMTSGIVSNSLMIFPFYSSTNSAEQSMCTIVAGKAGDILHYLMTF